MSQGASYYPISHLIARIVSESGLRRSEFVQVIGYKNTAKGLRRLDEWLDTGTGDEGCLQKITDVCHPDPGELEEALAATEAIHQREHQEAVRELEERERRRFRAFIWIVTEHGAHSFLTAVGERQVKTLWMPEGFEHLSPSEQLTAVQRQVREHYDKTGGRYVGFGEILRYWYADTYNTSAVLDIQGSVIEKNGERFLLPEVWLELQIR